MRHTFFSIVMITGMLLTACSSAATGMPGASSNDLPAAMQLAVGTLKLAGTSREVSVEQAKDLVVYWQVYKELRESETAAQAEIDGLTTQIQETMTAAQMQAISDMDLTQQDVFTSMQGVTVASSNSSASTVDAPSGNAMPAGNPPADAGGASPDGGLPADMGGAVPASSSGQTQSAQTASGRATTTDVPIALLEAVIQSLQQKIGV